MKTIAVFDTGKTNIKLSVTDEAGGLIETLSTPNAVHDGQPYRHHDLAAIEAWLVDGLATLADRHDIAAIVCTAHGSGGVLVDDEGPAMPMIDYEQAVPMEIDQEYREIAGSFRERGSAVMLGAAHLARQMLWLERGWPDAFRQARHFLATPQYWAWRLSGVAASEVTSLAAQSHLWCSADGRPARLIEARNWQRLIPPLQPAWSRLADIKPEISRRTGLKPTTAILCGIHDSSANFYQYQAAGLHDVTVVSTGTWIVAISDRSGPNFDLERAGLCCNADVQARPLPGMLTMGGREFAIVAGEDDRPTNADSLARLIETRTMVLPSFGSDDGLFPGTSRKGRLTGPLADHHDLRHALALLYAALLTDRCLQLVHTSTVVLDGSFVRDPLYGALIAALNPDRRVFVNADQYGTATGAALLASHETRQAPAPLALKATIPFSHPTLDEYREHWLRAAQTGGQDDGL
ncbi:carbohydrate kinase [Agrobacterium rhizogenes]|uniref:Carbohydrate kinase n=1 Tax=Rhizobium rhizogenes NBRC 13257 TaxID=1220581 RepID=A0AA87U6G0_RHIRH|nr:FGGY-family carbohydrate kinase [Rhizobium rhizogenes]OCJ19446.1 carbohydrate kinase [Agrobacterium sp. B133/95]NTF58813.1 carbohydrate kinase [Rhizobium rhizogenes]NTF78397.1 carbohydrate kinase [Rhizobium rhizogenes]NTF84984.1 carbohydrate kinase [Rhizobium rhizogenes]NTF97319.1 carbohydrate kinase [Rhizobium rhizogenes]